MPDETANNEITYLDVLEVLEKEMMNETDPEKKLKLAQTYKTMKDSYESDWKVAEEQKTARDNSKRTLIGAITGTVVGAALAAFIKGLMEMCTKLKFQENAIEAEEDGLRPGYRNQSDKLV